MPQHGAGLGSDSRSRLNTAGLGRAYDEEGGVYPSICGHVPEHGTAQLLHEEHVDTSRYMQLRDPWVSAQYRQLQIADRGRRLV